MTMQMSNLGLQIQSVGAMPTELCQRPGCGHTKDSHGVNGCVHQEEMDYGWGEAMMGVGDLCPCPKWVAPIHDQKICGGWRACLSCAKDMITHIFDSMESIEQNMGKAFTYKMDTSSREVYIAASQNIATNLKRKIAS